MHKRGNLTVCAVQLCVLLYEHLENGPRTAQLCVCVCVRVVQNVQLMGSFNHFSYMCFACGCVCVFLWRAMMTVPIDRNRRALTMMIRIMLIFFVATIGGFTCFEISADARSGNKGEFNVCGDDARTDWQMLTCAVAACLVSAHTHTHTQLHSHTRDCAA